MRRTDISIPRHEVDCGREDRDSQAAAGQLNANRRVLLLRALRRRELMGCSGLRLACLIIDYGVMLGEDNDPIEVILDYEFRKRNNHSA